MTCARCMLGKQQWFRERASVFRYTYIASLGHFIIIITSFYGFRSSVDVVSILLGRGVAS
jgi:hypothetical protein